MIYDVVSVVYEFGKVIIVDGGIKYFGDIVKVLVVGGNVVMFGLMLFGMIEVLGEVYEDNGKKYKFYWGMGFVGVMV